MPITLKAEIIYFCEQSDPRLEFGLSGDYPSRTLSPSCSDYREYLYALKKAVSRNNLILVVGGFGENGEMARVTGLAVGREPKRIDFQKLGYGEVSGAPEMLPESGLPLVDKEGGFAGVLLESGPQAIVLLDEKNKNRGYIIRDLIAPYLSELYNTVINKKEN